MNRGRPPPPVRSYVCTHCAFDKPTIRNGVHVKCSKCNAAPNRHLAQLWDLPDWPRVTTVEEKVA